MVSDVSEEVIAEGLAKCEAATPGPLVVSEGHPGSGPWDRLTVEAQGTVICTVNRLIDSGHANAALIAYAGTHLRDILLALRAAEQRASWYGLLAQAANSHVAEACWGKDRGTGYICIGSPTRIPCDFDESGLPIETPELRAALAAKGGGDDAE